MLCSLALTAGLFRLSPCPGRFLRDSIITQEQADFVDAFSGEVAAPATLPRWLWGGRPLARKHPTIKLAVRASSGGGAGALAG
jgi:hypothetical protein